MGDDAELPSDRSKNLLSKRAEKLISEETTWTDLLLHLDVDFLEDRDGHASWHAGTSFEPMFKAILWARVEEIDYSTIPDRLEEDPGLARAMGFDPRDLPSDSTFRPARVRSRFDNLEPVLNNAEYHIRHIAAERGSPIGSALKTPETSTEYGDDEESPSERTKDRLLRKKGREVLDELQRSILPSITLPRPEDPVYDSQELLKLESLAGIQTDTAANSAGKSLGDKKNPDPDLDDPFYEDGPTGETLLESIKQLSVDEIAYLINEALQKTHVRMKPVLNELEQENGNRFGTNMHVAIDITYVAYYGDRDGMKWLQGAPDDKEYDWCHKFATATIVGKNIHQVLGVTPLGNTEWVDHEPMPGPDTSHYPGEVVRRLLDIVTDYVDIKTVYADREFFAVDVISAFEERNLKYLIPAVKNSRVKSKCNEFDDIKRGYQDEPGDEALYVEHGYPMYSRVKHCTRYTRVTTTLAITPPDEDAEGVESGEPIPYVTNLDIDDEISLDRRWATKQLDKYQNRGGIETSYKSIKKCAAYTTSKEFSVRWFHFGFACIIYNMWLLVDFLTQHRIGEIETRTKPRINLSRFLEWFDDKFGWFLAPDRTGR